MSKKPAEKPSVLLRRHTRFITDRAECTDNMNQPDLGRKEKVVVQPVKVCRSVFICVELNA